VIGHVVWLRFRDGTSGEIYLAPALRGPIFEPLRNPAVFSQRVAIRVIRLRDELICGPFSSRGNEQVGISISRTAEEGKLRLPLRYPLPWVTERVIFASPENPEDRNLARCAALNRRAPGLQAESAKPSGSV